MLRRPLTAVIHNAVFGNILMLLIVCAGVIAAFRMIREVLPRFSLDMVSVTVAYPGAGPAEIEEGICLKLEEALEGLEGVHQVSTTAAEGVGTALVECEDDADIIEMKNDVASRVDAIVTFPEDAEEPMVQDLKFPGDVLGIAVWGDAPEHQLRDLGLSIKDDLLALRDISQVSVSGIRDCEIGIEIAEEKLRQYGLSLGDVSRAIAGTSLDVPLGQIRTGTEEFRIRATARGYTAEDYAAMPIITTPDGAIIRLRDVATVRDTFDEDAGVSARFNGKPSVSVDVFKTEDEDAIRIAAAVDAYLARKSTEIPPGVQLTKWRDNSRFVEQRLNMLLRNGWIGLTLVFVSLWLFLDLRLSFWVAMGIPISIAGGLALMGATGETLNMLSLFGLIMVLGLIVDDAIVVGEAIYVHRKHGEDSIQAAIAGTVEVAWPVIAAVVTTIVAFLPLFFVSGVMGKFIRHIPTPVVAALTVSLAEALIILPVHLRHLPDLAHTPELSFFSWPRVLRRKISHGLEWFIDRVYGSAMDRILRWRYVAIAVSVAVLLVTIGMIRGGIIKYVLFPETDSDFLVATIELPAGTPAARTRIVADQVLAGWREVEKQVPVSDGNVLTVAVYTLFGASLRPGVGADGAHMMEVYVEMLPSEVRNAHCRDLSRLWEQHVGPIPDVVAARFDAAEQGPGGRPLELRLLSNDSDSLLAAADALVEKLRSVDGTFDVQSDYRPGKREFQIDLKPEARPLGLTVADVATQLRNGFYGAEVLRVQRGRDEVKVKVRYPLVGGRDTIGALEDVRVRTPLGDEVPLLSIADLSVTEGYTTIRRQRRMRAVTVSSDVDRRLANAQEIADDLAATFLPELKRRFPTVDYSTEGQSRQTQESLDSLKIGFPLALIGIYLILATIFHSYVQPVVIMVTIPFGLIGAAYGHLLFGISLTMMSLFGMVALAGIVVNDAIVLIEAVNTRIAEGATVMDALREGGKRRFRAIFLTTLTTFAGLTPIILEKSMQAQFLIPMAIAIAFGVAFATLLTLIVIPCLLAMVNDARRLVYLALTMCWPTREHVEPATRRGR